MVTRLEVSMANYERSMNRAQRKANTSAGGVERRFNRMNRRLERSGQALSRTFTRAFAPVIALAAPAALGAVATRALSAAEAIQDMSRRANVGAEFLQELRFVASQNGASTRDFDDAISRLNRRLGLFVTNGGGPAAQAFERLGLNTRIASGELGDAESVFNASVAALEGVENAAERSALASQLFGEDSGPRLVQMMSLGTDAMTEQREAARELGVVMEDALVDKAAAASDTLERMQMQFSTQVNSAIADNAAELVRLAEALADVATFAINAGSSLSSFFDAAQRTFSERQRSPVTKEQFDNEIDDITDAIGDYGGRVFNGGRHATNLGRLRSFLGESELQRLTDAAAGDSTSEEFSRLVLDALIARRDELASLRRELDAAIAARPLPRQRVSSSSTSITQSTAAEPTPEAETVETTQQGADLFDRQAEVSGEKAKAAAQALHERRGEFSQSFGKMFADGAVAAMDGNLAEAFAQNVRSALANSLYSLFSRLGEMVFNNMSGPASKGGVVSNLASAVFGGFRAQGGPVSPGKAYTVGERGRETFVPSVPGRIIPGDVTTVASARRSAPPVVRVVLEEGAMFEPRVQKVAGDVAVQTSRRAYAETSRQMAERDSHTSRRLR